METFMIGFVFGLIVMRFIATLYFMNRCKHKRTIIAEGTLTRNQIPSGLYCVKACEICKNRKRIEY